MSRAVIAWFVASVAAIVLSMLVMGVVPGAGSVLLVGGVISLMAFLLFVWRRAVTQNDQWVWQTPHKPRREYEVEQAAKAARSATDSTGAPRDAAG